MMDDNFTPGGVVHFHYEGVRYDIFVLDAQDRIARHLMKGSFYETEELEIIRRHMPENAAVVEVGANIGNHTVYFEKVLRCRRNVVFEPNPQAIRALRLTMRLNGLRRVDASHLGVALSDREGRGELSVPPTNLGGASFEPADGGSIQCVAGDALLGRRRVDFIKIDVERTEMQVLAGMRQLIARCRPVMFIEVDAANEAAFLHWRTQEGYEVLETFKRYRTNTNYLVAAAGGRGALPRRV